MIMEQSKEDLGHTLDPSDWLALVTTELGNLSKLYRIYCFGYGIIQLLISRKDNDLA
jgi:hypothetical protein